MDYKAIKEYIYRKEEIQNKYSKNEDLNAINNMEAIDYFILHQLYPKIYKIDKNKRGLDFDASTLS